MSDYYGMQPDELIEAYMNAPIGIVLTHRRHILTTNHAFAAMFGYAIDEVIGASMALFYDSNEEFERIGNIWGRELRNRSSYHDLRIMRRKNGTMFWVRGRGVSLTPEDPFARGIWSYSDLTREKPWVELTMRERQVAMLVVEGKSAKEIARELEISPRTVEAHRNKLMDKYGARNTGDLIARLASSPIAP